MPAYGSASTLSDAGRSSMFRNSTVVAYILAPDTAAILNWTFLGFIGVFAMIVVSGFFATCRFCGLLVWQQCHTRSIRPAGVQLF